MESSGSFQEAPWYNGCSEAMIRSVKKSVVIGNQIVTFNELQTFLFESANLVSERPIGKKSKPLGDGSYLPPNNLL